jgi:hypothetical protein
MRMKKLFLLFLVALIVHIDVFAHASTITRSWCGGFFHRRFVAIARATTLSFETYTTGFQYVNNTWVWVGTSPKPKLNVVCDRDDRGCTRPRNAICSISGQVVDIEFMPVGTPNNFSVFNYAVNARAHHLISGITLVQTATGRGRAGLTGQFDINNEQYANLSDEGFSHSSIDGDVDIKETGQLIVRRLSGNVANGSQFYSKLKLLVFKERTDMTEDEARRADEQMKAGIFENVVYGNELTVTRTGVLRTGLFETLNDESLSDFQEADTTGVRLNIKDLIINVDVRLANNEKLSVVTLVDGALDIANNSPAPQLPAVSNNQEVTDAGGVIKQLQVYPNPAGKTLNISLLSEVDNAAVSVRVVDATGRLTRELYVGRLRKGMNMLDDLNVSQYPRGIYYILIRIGDKLVTRKITFE